MSELDKDKVYIAVSTDGRFGPSPFDSPSTWSWLEWEDNPKPGWYFHGYTVNPESMGQSWTP